MSAEWDVATYKRNYDRLMELAKKQRDALEAAEQALRLDLPLTRPAQEMAYEIVRSALHG